MAFARFSHIVPLLPLFFAACGGDGGTTEPPPPVATSISLSASLDTLRALGATLTIQATVRDQGGNVMSPAPALTWTSSDPGVASVASGSVTALANGGSLITATTGTLSAAVHVHVLQRPSAVIVVSGNGQSGVAGSQLGAELVVRVQDSGGATIAGAPVAWTVTAGGGQLSSAQGPTDASGHASTSWTLGSTSSSQSVEASAGSGAGATFSATATVPGDPLMIETITPAIIEEGAQATISGAGLQGAAVDVGGVPAQVVSSSATTLTFTVPAGGCRPTRTDDVRVQRDGAEATKSATVRPADRIAPLDFGHIWMSFGTGSQGHCLHLDPQGSPVRYLIGVQSLAGSASSISPSSLRISSSSVATAGFAGGAAAISGAGPGVPADLAHRSLDVTPVSGLAASLTASPAAGSPALSATSAGEARRQHAHAEHTERSLDLVRQLRGVARPGVEALASRVPATVSVGTQLSVRVPSGCDTYTPITGTVRVAGSRAIWIEDNASPAGGFSEGQYDQLAALYDGTIGSELDRYLGPPTDLDSNGRVVIVVTPEVNKLGNVNGFVWPTDFLPRSICESSNEGEYFYVVAPDPNGATPRQVSAAELLGFYPSLLAHEMTHVIHFSQQMVLPGNQVLPTIWEAEGFATFLEQLVGHAFTGLGSGQNLGLSAVQAESDWYADMFYDLAGYYGFQSQTSQLDTAPHECSWLARPPNGPCAGASRLLYGVPASLFRWIADFAWTPASEAQMTRAIVSSTTHGLPLLAELASEELHWVQALWAIALAADGRYFDSGVATFSSWNMHDVFGGFHATARLNPRQASHSFSSQFNVRGGSMAYFTVDGSHPEIAIAAENLPSTMRLWLVRVQ